MNLLADATYPAALFAGVLSFFSPCVVPLIPSYFCFITGLTLDELTAASQAAVRRKIIRSTLAFVLGFSVVFIALGISISYLGSLFGEQKALISTIGGHLIILFGLHLTGVIRIPMLEFEKRLHIQQKPLHLFGTFFIGMAFGAGWTPCIGPILGSILVLAQQKETVMQATGLLGAYSVGMALPFMCLSVGVNFLLGFIRRTKMVMRFINPVAGILLVLIGLALVTDSLKLLTWY